MVGMQMVMTLSPYCTMTLSTTFDINMYNCPKPLYLPNQFHVQFYGMVS